MKIISVQGNPGSGKTTQCEEILNKGLDGISIYHISAGKMLRGIRTKEILSKYSSEVTSPNVRLPLLDNLVNNIIFEAINEEDDDDAITLIDGYPRHPEAVGLFLETIHLKGYEFLGTISMLVPKDIGIERVVTRGLRRGEKISDNSLSRYTELRFERDSQTTNRAIEMLGRAAVIRYIDAGDDLSVVRKVFAKSIRYLIDSSINLKVNS